MKVKVQVFSPMSEMISECSFLIKFKGIVQKKYCGAFRSVDFPFIIKMDLANVILTSELYNLLEQFIFVP